MIVPAVSIMSSTRTHLPATRRRRGWRRPRSGTSRLVTKARGAPPSFFFDHFGDADTPASGETTAVLDRSTVRARSPRGPVYEEVIDGAVEEALFCEYAVHAHAMHVKPAVCGVQVGAMRGGRRWARGPGSASLSRRE